MLEHLNNRKLSVFHSQEISPVRFTKRGEAFIVVTFAKEEENENEITATKAYSKCLFLHTHTLLFKKAETREHFTVMASRILIPLEKEYYILDSQGNKMKRINGNYRKAKMITMFLLADEDVEVEYQKACNTLTRKNAWVLDAKEELLQLIAPLSFRIRYAIKRASIEDIPQLIRVCKTKELCKQGGFGKLSQLELSLWLTFNKLI